MSIRGVYTANGGPPAVICEGGPIDRFTLTLADGWKVLPVPDDCDLVRVRVSPGGKEVLYTHSLANPDIEIGTEPTVEEIAHSDILDPGVHFMGTNMAPGVLLYVALDPNDGTPQSEPTVITVRQAAKV